MYFDDENVLCKMNPQCQIIVTDCKCPFNDIKETKLIKRTIKFFTNIFSIISIRLNYHKLSRYWIYYFLNLCFKILRKFTTVHGYILLSS